MKLDEWLLKYFTERSVCPFLDISLNASSKQMTNFDSTDLRSSSWKYSGNQSGIIT